MSNDASLLDASNSWTSFSAHGSCSNNAASTVRSRNRRIGQNTDVSDIDGPGGSSELQRPSRRSASNGVVSAHSSRTASPIPSKRLTRTADGRSIPGERPLGGSSFGGLREDRSSRKPTRGFATELLDSPWASLQGFASNLLGNGNELWESRTPGRDPAGAPRSRLQGPTSWGPPASIIGDSNPDAQKERLALVQAKKRDALLQANGDTFPDSLGNFKRRGSEDNFAGSTAASTPGHEDGNALVYIHVVQSSDTLTGVSIRYGCPLAALRKANGFWPSDSIQSRKTIMLPVESCTLRGTQIPAEEVQRRIGGANGDELNRDTSSLVPDTNTNRASEFEFGNVNIPEDHERYGPPKRESDTAGDPPWEHHSWVELRGFLSLVEIGRLPRKCLGFFPRARRKSQAQLSPYCDLPSSPSASVRDYFTSDTHYNQSCAPRNSTLSSRTGLSCDGLASGIRSPRYSGSQQRSQRSIALSGPGGVGTLENALYPGPPIDKLTTFVNSHLPTLTVKPAPTYTKPTSSSLNSQERTSLDSGDSSLVSSSPAAGLEHVGGAIEGWFRKVATRAKAGIDELQHQQALSQQFANLGIAGTSGDLIELNDASENSRPQRSPLTVSDRSSSGQETSGLFADPGLVRRNASNNVASSSPKQVDILRREYQITAGTDRAKED